jgi:hypothetical protein
VASDQERLRRRALLKIGTALAASLAAVPVTGRSAEPSTSVEPRAKKATKALLHYQDQPRNGKVCAGCWAYIAGPLAGEGTCKAIEGEISANGWCMAYSPRRPLSRLGVAS